MARTKFYVYSVELTDTFGGEANYSWVRRATIRTAEDTTWQETCQEAARSIGYKFTDAEIDTATDYGYGDCYTVESVEDNVVMFVTYEYDDYEDSDDDDDGDDVDATGYDYSYAHGGLVIRTPSGTCLLQGEEAGELYDQLEAASLAGMVRILSEYQHVCE